MYKTVTNLLKILHVVIFLGFSMPILGLFPGKNGTPSLLRLNEAVYFRVSVTGILIAVICIPICILLKSKVKHMDGEIKKLVTCTAPVIEYHKNKNICVVSYNINGDKYKNNFDLLKVHKSKKDSYVTYKNYKNQIIPIQVYLEASPK